MLLLSGPATASANYYLTRPQARELAQDWWLHYRNYDAAYTRCDHPQGLKHARPGFAYHRWVCDFDATSGLPPGRPDCSGVMVIVGSTAGYYGYTVYNDGPCPKYSNTR